MNKFDINAIFYSKQNIQLAYNLKQYCRELGVNLINAIVLSELISLLNEYLINIVFIDLENIECNKGILNAIKSFDEYNNLKIVCLYNTTSKETKFCDELVDYNVSYSNLKNKLKEIVQEISLNACNICKIKYDINEINTFLTKYLLNLGFAPKHIGFSFIKYAIELAIKSNAMLPSLSKTVYPKVATKFQTLPQNVERNIRNSIDCACKSNENLDYDLKLLMQNGKISNRAFLGYLLDKVVNIYAEK